MFRQETMGLLQTTPRFNSVSITHLRRWISNREKVKKRRGVKPLTYFEENVWALLVIAVLVPNPNGTSKAVIKHHALYSYDIIQTAARAARNHPQFLGDVKVQALTFSNKWVRGFLDRERMRKRKITSVTKEIPPVEEVRKIMGIGQAVIMALFFVAHQIWNMDETAFTWVIGPQHAYVPADARRAEGEQSDTKQRITVALMT